MDRIRENYEYRLRMNVTERFVSYGAEVISLLSLLFLTQRRPLRTGKARVRSSASRLIEQTMPIVSHAC